MQIAEIKKIAYDAHNGQRDLEGRDYFYWHLTPIALAAEAFKDADIVAAAWLHDILEDTAVSSGDLRAYGVSETIIGAVEAVSRWHPEPYKQLIERSAAHEVGRYVKLVDNAWNILSNPSLAKKEPQKAASMLRKRYEPARTKLLAACNLTLTSPQYVQVLDILKTFIR